MLLNRANLDALYKAVITGFQAGMAQVPPVDLGFAVTPFPSATAANLYPFFENIPGFREWVGDRQFQDLSAQLYEVPNRDFELSQALKAKHIEDDTYGVLPNLVQLAAAAWPVQLHELLVEVLTNQIKAWDGKDFFATDHKYGKNTIANKVTDALTKASFEAAFTNAAAWKFSNNKPCRTQWTHLLYGPKLSATVWDLVSNEYVVAAAATGDTTTPKVGGAVKNRNFKRVVPVEIPDFVGDYDDYWVLLDCSKGLKPLLRQVRKTPTPLMTTNPEEIAKEGSVKVMADGRAAAAPTLFHLAYGGIL